MNLFEFIEFLTEGTRIEHPEDLVFLGGSQGASHAITALAEVVDRPRDIKIKWDGYPALIFGRNADGQLVVADKHMFTKKDGTGRVTSLQNFIQYDLNRGANRGDLYQKLKVLWPAIEKAVPANARGYYWGDLLWVGVPAVQAGSYVFKPNTVTYSIAANSALGQRISQSVAGVVVHQYFGDFDEPATVLQGTGELNVNGPLMILTTDMGNTVNLVTPVRLFDKANRDLQQLGPAIDKLLDPTNLSGLKIKDLPGLMTRYVNARVRGEQGKFVDWVQTKVTANKIKTLVGENQDGYLYQNAAGLNGAFLLFDDIARIKMNLIQQLDRNQQTIKSTINGKVAGEGYVFSTKHGLIKLVNRAMFSAANFAKND